jgi:5'-methylthioadenosine phosphorylase
VPLIGIIGGSGLYNIDALRVIEERSITTPFGEPSASYKIGEIEGIEVAFLPRHGTPHRLPPHLVNYMANIYGFKSIGVERIIAISAGGGIEPSLRAGDIVLLAQIIDMTQGARKGTFYDDEVVHVDFTEPFCPELKNALMAASGGALREATYICTNGPRLESKAEIRFFSLIGGDVVGMTSMPEAALARELELCYGGLCVVTNPAAGLSQERLSARDVIEKMKEAEVRVKEILLNALRHIPKERACPCKDALREARPNP